MKVVKTFSEYLKMASGAPEEIYPAAIKYTKEKTGAKGKELFLPIRAAIAGKSMARNWIKYLLFSVKMLLLCKE